MCSQSRSSSRRIFLESCLAVCSVHTSITGKDLLQFITVFWASPTCTPGYLSRSLQATVVACSRKNTFLGLLECTRLFGYETSSGMGRALIAYLIMCGAGPWTNSRLYKYRSDTTMKLLAIICSCSTLLARLCAADSCHGFCSLCSSMACSGHEYIISTIPSLPPYGAGHATAAHGHTDCGAFLAPHHVILPTMVSSKIFPLQARRNTALFEYSYYFLSPSE
ncbi:hypothetical protein BDR03DRAFT_264802 [Suillus americanus]|nr:hypothetical protein BDR03DRAFT_264802 [Suillus americanus]